MIGLKHFVFTFGLKPVNPESKYGKTYHTPQDGAFLDDVFCLFGSNICPSDYPNINRIGQKLGVGHGDVSLVFVGGFCGAEH
jgi:hypothetical protein